MNTSQDWDVVWRWHWFRRSLWQPHYRDTSHPEGRPARTTPIWKWVLDKYGASRVLDCNCGLGLRAILLHEAGLDVVGTDSSGEAILHAKELAEVRDLTVPFHQLPWQELADNFGHEFDAVVNDAFSTSLNRSLLRFAAHNFFSVLKPGGVFVFTGADQFSNPETKADAIERVWAAAPRFQILADHDQGGTHLTLVVARDKTEDGIVENYLFVVRDEAGIRLEEAEICNSVHWTWKDYEHVLFEAGFTTVESVKVPIGPREHVLNVAVK